MFRKKELMTCLFCGKECEPVYSTPQLRFGLCGEHFAEYKRYALTEANRKFPGLVLKALIRVYEECDDLIKILKEEANFHATCLESELAVCARTHRDIDEALMHFGALKALTNVLVSIGHYEFRERKEIFEKRLYDQGFYLKNK